jgi:hypothetical protein
MFAICIVGYAGWTVLAVFAALMAESGGKDSQPWMALFLLWPMGELIGPGSASRETLRNMIGFPARAGGCLRHWSRWLPSLRSLWFLSCQAIGL